MCVWCGRGTMELRVVVVAGRVWLVGTTVHLCSLGEVARVAITELPWAFFVNTATDTALFVFALLLLLARQCIMPSDGRWSTRPLWLTDQSTVCAQVGADQTGVVWLRLVRSPCVGAVVVHLVGSALRGSVSFSCALAMSMCTVCSPGGAFVVHICYYLPL